MVLDPELDIKDLEKQKFVDDGSGNVSVRTSAVLDIEYSTTTSSHNTTLTNANTEYSKAIPDDTKQFRFRARTPVAIRYAWQTGKVATPTEPYFTLPAGLDYASDAVLLTSETLYFATTVSGTVVELEAMT